MIIALVAGLIGYFAPHPHPAFEKVSSRDDVAAASDQTPANADAPSFNLSEVTRSLSTACHSSNERGVASQAESDPRRRADRDVQDMADDLIEMCRTSGSRTTWCEDLQTLYYRHLELSSKLEKFAEEMRADCEEGHHLNSCLTTAQLAANVGNQVLQFRMERVACDADDSESCDSLTHHLGINNLASPQEMYALTVKSCKLTDAPNLEHRGYCKKIVETPYSDELYNELYNEKDGWGNYVISRPRRDEATSFISAPTASE